jgi:hypothetical protein
MDLILILIALLLLTIIILQRRTMSAIDDLTTAVTALESAVTNAVNKINTLKATPGVDPTQVETLVARVNTAVSNLQAAIA